MKNYHQKVSSTQKTVKGAVFGAELQDSRLFVHFFKPFTYRSAFEQPLFLQKFQLVLHYRIETICTVYLIYLIEKHSIKVQHITMRNYMVFALGEDFGVSIVRPMDQQDVLALKRLLWFILDTPVWHSIPFASKKGFQPFIVCFLGGSLQNFLEQIIPVSALKHSQKN